jgi:hypothetical protein
MVLGTYLRTVLIISINMAGKKISRNTSNNFINCVDSFLSAFCRPYDPSGAENPWSQLPASGTAENTNLTATGNGSVPGFGNRPSMYAGANGPRPPETGGGLRPPDIGGLASGHRPPETLRPPEAHSTGSSLQGTPSSFGSRQPEKPARHPPPESGGYPPPKDPPGTAAEEQAAGCSPITLGMTCHKQNDYKILKCSFRFKNISYLFVVVVL